MAAIVLTDPKPLTEATTCPQCHADESKRVVVNGFGVPREACSQCGYQFGGVRG